MESPEDGMYLTGLVHRDRLFDVATRWFRDRVEPEDGRFVTQVFIYESLISGLPARRFLTDILRTVHPEPFRLARMHLKDEVRQAILDGCLKPTPRMAALFEQYRQVPEEFFPRTPVDLMLATDATGRLLGMTRVKRIRRVAEKASRRVADHLAGEIQERARTLAAQRASRAGLPLDHLITPLEVMEQEFETAERIVSQAFREQELVFPPAALRIDDFIGLKFVGPPEVQIRVEQAIAQHPRATIVEREVHQGDYNAINLLVDIALPTATEIVERMLGQDWRFATGRGLMPEELALGFPGYVESGAHTFRAEVILTSYEELVESEFGRSMHEVRVIDQREKMAYKGRIAMNASYIIEFLLMLALSPTVAVDSLPVKMWGRYLPDTFSTAVWQLFGIIPGAALWEALMPSRRELLRMVEAGWDHALPGDEQERRIGEVG
jgi:hypothetical protein